MFTETQTQKKPIEVLNANYTSIIHAENVKYWIDSHYKTNNNS